MRVDLPKIGTSQSARHLLKWFDPRANRVGTFAFILNRITAIGLTVYLFLHLLMLSQLARGAEAFDGFISLVKNPLFTAGEYLVVAACLLHGLNGLRIAITSFALGVSHQRKLFYIFIGLAAAGCLYFAVRMFGGD
jgi:succinate dehydrogenase / fumarate reductase cytochrome b subunit